MKTAETLYVTTSFKPTSQYGHKHIECKFLTCCLNISQIIQFPKPKGHMCEQNRKSPGSNTFQRFRADMKAEQSNPVFRRMCVKKNFYYNQKVIYQKWLISKTVDDFLTKFPPFLQNLPRRAPPFPRKILATPFPGLTCVYTEGVFFANVQTLAVLSVKKICLNQTTYGNE